MKPIDSLQGLVGWQVVEKVRPAFPYCYTKTVVVTCLGEGVLNFCLPLRQAVEGSLYDIPT